MLHPRIGSGKFMSRENYWHMRQEWDEDVFDNIIVNQRLRTTLKNWRQGIDDRTTLAAIIDITSDNPFNFEIIDHRRPLVAGVKFSGVPLRDYDDGWEPHFDELAGEYREAKCNGKIICHQIFQGLGGIERKYERTIKREGNVLIVASASILPPPQSARDHPTYQ